MVEAVQSGEFVSNHVSSPILIYSHSEKSVEAHSGSHHKVGAIGIFSITLGQDARRDIDESAQHALGKAIHHFGAAGSGEILLGSVNESVDYTVGHLSLRQTIDRGRVEHRELRKTFRIVERIFLLRGSARDYCATVHLRAGGGQSEHRAERQCGRHFGFAGNKFPRVAIVVDAGSYEFGAIDNRATAYGENKVDFLGFTERNGSHKSVVIGVGFDAAKLYYGALAQRIGHLLVYAVTLY